MKIEKNITKSNAYFHYVVLFQIPTNGADFVPEVEYVWGGV